MISLLEADLGRDEIVGFRPYRLWSLWDMLEINASAFLEAKHLISTTLQRLDNNAPAGHMAMVRPSYEEVSGALELLRQHATTVHLPLTLKSIEAAQKHLAAAKEYSQGFVVAGVEFLQFRRYVDELIKRFRDEYSTRILLAIPYNRASFYNKADDYFGSKVLGQFASVSYEIDEACKCFALNRHTACVFHLMRLMEKGIGAVRMCLAIPDPVKPAQRNWGAILKTVKDELDRRNAKGGPGWAAGADKVFFDEAYLLLTTVKDTWRNSTMHVENKYIEEEAEHVLNAVRSFMRKIAGRMDEDGLPLA